MLKCEPGELVIVQEIGEQIGNQTAGRCQKCLALLHFNAKPLAGHLEKSQISRQDGFLVLQHKEIGDGFIAHGDFGHHVAHRHASKLGEQNRLRGEIAC